jgi:hypothetical protein
MNAYEELVERCMIAAPSAWDLDTWVRVVLAEVRRTLEDAAEREQTPLARTILDWLDSCPLNPTVQS